MDDPPSLRADDPTTFTSGSGSGHTGNELHQGQTIFGERKRCSLSILDGHTLLTARHCVTQENETFYLDRERTLPFGTVSRVLAEADIAVIAAADPKTTSRIPRHYGSVIPGTALTMITEQSGQRDMYQFSLPPFGSETVHHVALASPCVTAPGDSGGPVISDDGALVGVISGCSTLGTRYSPIPTVL